MANIKRRRPRTSNLENVFKWFDELGVRVYGGNIDLETGQEFPACRDFDLDELIRLHELQRDDKIWREEGM